MNDILNRIAKHIRFRFVEVSDAEFILSLRLDEAKCQFLSAVSPDIAAQRNWIAGYKAREKEQREYYYIISSIDWAELGVVRLYDFVGDSFCWGSWILKKEAPIYAAIESALAIYEFAFYTLGFERSHFDVRKGNTKVIDFHRRFGAVTTGEDELNYYFDIGKKTYENTRQRYKRFLVCGEPACAVSST